MAIAVDNWATFDGYAVAHSMPELGELPLSRFCSFVWWMVTRNQEKKEVDEFERKLWRPPVGEVGQGVWSAEAEMSAFAAAKKALNLS